MRSILVSILLFACGAGLLDAQEGDKHYIDSLKNEFQKSTTDTARSLLLSKISFAYHNISTTKGLSIGKQAYDLAIKENFSTGQANALNALATNYNVQSDYPNSIECYLKALRIYEHKKDTFGITTILSNLSISYLNRDNFSKAEEVLQRSLALSLILKDQEKIATNYTNLANIKYKQKKFENAVSIFYKVARISRELKDEEGVAIAYNNIGACYSELNKPELALLYFDSSYVMFKKLENYRGAGVSLFGKAEHLSKYLDSAQQLGQTKLELASSAESLFLQAENYLQRTQSIESLASINEELSNLAEKMNDPAKALKFYKMAKIYRDSVFNEKSAEKVTSLQMQYELEVAETEAKYKAELALAEENRKYYMQVAGVIAFVLGIVSLLLYLRKRKIKPFTLKILGSFSLLVVFEFITLLLHPHIIHLTHHHLVFTLLCLVVLASIVVPAHHKIEHWLHSKLVSHTNVISNETESEIAENELENNNSNQSQTP